MANICYKKIKCKDCSYFRFDDDKQRFCCFATGAELLQTEEYILSPDLQRIKHIRDYCREIEKTISRYGGSFDIFDHDPDYQRSIYFSILQIGELSGGLSSDYRQAATNRIQWEPIKGMRSLVAHSDGSISQEIIWKTAVVDIPVLLQFCEEQLSNSEF